MSSDGKSEVYIGNLGAVTTAQKAEAKATHQSLSIGLFIGLYFITQKV